MSKFIFSLILVAAIVLPTSSFAGVPDKCTLLALSRDNRTPVQTLGTFEAEVGEEVSTTKVFTHAGKKITATAQTISRTIRARI